MNERDTHKLGTSHRYVVVVFVLFVFVVFVLFVAFVFVCACVGAAVLVGLAFRRFRRCRVRCV